MEVKSRVQVFIKCINLKDVEILSKSDPLVEVYEKNNNDLSFIGKTEVIWDSLNPKFATCIEMDYYFELKKILCFKIHDINIENNIEVKGEFLGESEFTLGSIVGSRGNWLRNDLIDEQGNVTKGSIFVRAEEVDEGNFGKVTIQFEGHSLKSKKFMCCSAFKPMFNIYRMMERDEHQIVYSSEPSRGNDPLWKPIRKTIRELTAGDLSRQMVFQLFDYAYSGNHKLIGSFSFTLLDIRDNENQSFIVLNKFNKEKGEIRLAKLKIKKQPSFLDYIYGGCQINLIIGIDFTRSNGNPIGPSSLHYIEPNNYNQYQIALKSVSEILLNYDTDKQVPVYGFGAQVRGEVNHCFALNFNEDQPSVDNIEGIMKVYNDGIRKITLSRPTNFSPIISKAARMAKEANVDQINQQYFIRASTYPLSIIIVGIGSADFENMEKLDGDDGMLRDSKKRMSERDIVQFVAFNQFKNDPVALTREVLAEVPREILNYFESRKLKPNPKLEAYQDELNNY